MNIENHMTIGPDADNSEVLNSKPEPLICLLCNSEYEGELFKYISTDSIKPVRGCKDCFDYAFENFNAKEIN